MSKTLSALGVALTAGLVAALAWLTTPTPAGICRRIDAELTGCIASVPRGAVEQCKECIARARAEAIAAGLEPNDCGEDRFESERSCF